MFMENSMTFQYMYTMCDDQIKVIDIICVTCHYLIDTYQFFALDTFKILSISYFEAIQTIVIHSSYPTVL
jgi:hypothetical protein